MMSRRTSWQSHQGSTTRRKAQIIIVVVVVVSLFAAWTILASSGALDSVFRQKGDKKAVSIANLNSNSPSKEYIYAGGRLVATEEPTATTLAAPANLRATTTSSTQIQITWNSVAGATRYELQRSSNYGDSNDHGFVAIQTNLTGTTYTDTVGSNAAYIYRVRAFDAPFPGGNASRPSNLDLAIALVFTEDPVVQLMTVKEVHVTQLRQAVDAVRVASGLSAAAWNDPPPLAQIVNIKKVHVDQLRSNLDGARSTLSLPAPTYTDPAITQFSTKVKAAHVQELRRLVKGYMTAIDNP
jgi:hypothetical protein